MALICRWRANPDNQSGHSQLQFQLETRTADLPSQSSMRSDKQNLMARKKATSEPVMVSKQIVLEDDLFAYSWPTFT
jgi:hypothetical protein